MTEPGAQLPLKGIRVADFSRVVAGPYSTYLLARMGAEVIKIEGVNPLDHTREVGPYTDETRDRNRSGYFGAVNAGKKSVTLHLQDPEHADMAREIASASDIVVESFMAGTMEKWGLGYEELASINPGIVMVSCSGFGRTGPMRSHSAYMNTIAAFVGLTSLNSIGAEQPTPVGATFSDLVAGTSIAFASLLALRNARSTGRGSYIDLSMAEATMALMGEPFVEHFTNGPVEGSTGTPGIRLQGVFRTSGDDKWIAISVRTEEQWQSLVEAMGMPAGSSSSMEGHDRNDHADLDAHITEWARTFDNLELTELLQRAGVPALPASDPEDVVRNPHFLSRGAIAPQNYALEPGRLMPNLPWHFESHPMLDFSLPAPPMLGEHNAEILGALTSATKETIRAIKQAAAHAVEAPVR